MADNYEKALQQPTGQHLMINTFGMAYVYYNGKEIARTDEAAPNIGTPDFNFIVRINQSQTIDIQRRVTSPAIPILVSIEEKGHRVSQVRVNETELHIPPNYVAVNDTLCPKFSWRTVAPFTSGFRILLMQSDFVRRVDVRFLNHSWVSLFVVDHQLVTACLQGDEKAEALFQLCTQVHTSTLRHGETVAARRFGLRSAPRSLKSKQTQSGTSSPNMPKLVTHSEPSKDREEPSTSAAGDTKKKGPKAKSPKEESPKEKPPKEESPKEDQKFEEPATNNRAMIRELATVLAREIASRWEMLSAASSDADEKEEEAK